MEVVHLARYFHVCVVCVRIFKAELKLECRKLVGGGPILEALVFSLRVCTCFGCDVFTRGFVFSGKCHSSG